LISVGIDLKELGSAVELFEILPRDWNLKLIFTQKWAYVDMNWGGVNPRTPRQFQPCIWSSFSRIFSVSDCTRSETAADQRSLISDPDRAWLVSGLVETHN